MYGIFWLGIVTKWLSAIWVSSCACRWCVLGTLVSKMDCQLVKLTDWEIQCQYGLYSALRVICMYVIYIYIYGNEWSNVWSLVLYNLQLYCTSFDLDCFWIVDSWHYAYIYMCIYRSCTYKLCGMVSSGQCDLCPLPSDPNSPPGNRGLPRGHCLLAHHVPTLWKEGIWHLLIFLFLLFRLFVHLFMYYYLSFVL